MPQRSISLWLAAALAFGGPTAAHAFQVREKKEKLPEAGELTVSIVQCHNLDFSFLCPADWVMAPDPANQKIVFRTRDFAVRMVMQIRMGDSAARLPLHPAELRKQVLEQIPSATITGESKCYAGNLAGQAFDLRQQTASQVTTCCRMAFVPFSGGCVEFTLSTSPAYWSAVVREFEAFLTSFNVEPAFPIKSVADGPSPVVKAASSGLNH